jgi:hypothetical protein
MHRTTRFVVALALAALIGAPAPGYAKEVRGRSRASVSQGSARNGNRNRSSNANRNINTNQNRSVNRNVNRNVDVDVDIDRRGGAYYGGCCYHPVATAAAVATAAVVTAAVIGSVAHTLPPSCTTVIMNGFAYQQCGTVWYQPQIGASSTTYVVVEAPR